MSLPKVGHHVEDFFPEQRDRSSWVRLDDDRDLLILKTVDPDSENGDQTEIPVAHARALLDVCAGEIDYTRTVTHDPPTVPASEPPVATGQNPRVEFPV